MLNGGAGERIILEFTYISARKLQSVADASLSNSNPLCVKLFIPYIELMLKGESLVNVPNQITITRVALIPVFMIFLLAPMNLGKITIIGDSFPVTHFIAGVIFIIASCTDWVDGYYARKHNLVTNLGKLLDPLADKLLVAGALISLVELGYAPAWMTVVILAREFAVSGLRQIAAADGLVLAASRIAKWKTTIQIIAIAALMLHNIFFAAMDFPFAYLCLWLAVIITIISGLDYFVKNKRVILK